CHYPFVGDRVAFAKFVGRDRIINLGVSRGQRCLWFRGWIDRAERVWIELVNAPAGDTSSYRHAARVGDLSHWASDLAKNQGRDAVEQARSIVDVRVAYSSDVDQGPDCVRVPLTRHR